MQYGASVCKHQKLTQIFAGSSKKEKTSCASKKTRPPQLAYLRRLHVKTDIQNSGFHKTFIVDKLNGD